MSKKRSSVKTLIALSEHAVKYSGTGVRYAVRLSVVQPGPKYIHLYSHKLQFQKQEIKKAREKDTHNVLKNTTCPMHTNYEQWKLKIT